MKRFFIFFLRKYQKLISPDHGLLVRIGLKRQGYICVFYPSCSEYAILSLEKYGTLKGLFKSLRRVLRCHPWQKEHIDFP